MATKFWSAKTSEVSESARRQWRAAVAVFEAHRHGDAALVRFNLALADADEARWADAEAEVRQAIALDAERIGPRAKRGGGEHVVLARALAGLGRDDEARVAAETARAIGEELGDAELVAAAGAVSEGIGARGRRRRGGSASASAAASASASASAPASAADSAPASAGEALRPLRPTGSGAYGAGQPWE